MSQTTFYDLEWHPLRETANKLLLSAQEDFGPTSGTEGLDQSVKVSLVPTSRYHLETFLYLLDGLALVLVRSRLADGPASELRILVR
jgi:hypothetical protein